MDQIESSKGDRKHIDSDSIDLVGDEIVENLARAALVAALIGAFAYVTFPNPFSPTEFTLQVLGVFMAGILLGPVWGFIALILYLMAGAAGLPIYIGGTAGIGHLFFSPTSGYLLSFPLGAAIIGIGVHGTGELQDPETVGLIRLIGALIAGTVVIYAFGVLGLMIALNLGPIEAFLSGAVAFLPAEGLKMGAAIGIVRSDAIYAK